MGEIDFSVVSGVSGYVPPHNPYEGSFSNPISRWNTPPSFNLSPIRNCSIPQMTKKPISVMRMMKVIICIMRIFMGVVSDSLSTYLGHSHQKNSTESVQG